MTAGKMTLGNVLAIILFVVGIAVSSTVSYFNGKGAADTARALIQKDIDYMKLDIADLKAAKPELLSGRVDNLEGEVKKMNNNNQTIIDLLNEIDRNNSD